MSTHVCTAVPCPVCMCLMNGMQCEIIPWRKKCLYKRTSCSLQLHRLYWNRRNGFEFSSTNLRTSQSVESVHRLSSTGRTRCKIQLYLCECSGVLAKSGLADLLKNNKLGVPRPEKINKCARIVNYREYRAVIRNCFEFSQPSGDFNRPIQADV